MSNDRISLAISAASPAQLREFCETVLQIEVPPTANKMTIIAKMEEAGHHSDTITVPSTAAKEILGDPSKAVRFTERGRVVTEMRKGEVVERKQLCIVIQSSEEKGGDRPVPVSVNGTRLDIPRGTPCWVYEEYVEALRSAVELVYDPSTKGLQEPRSRRAYPFEVLSGPDTAGALDATSLLADRVA